MNVWKALRGTIALAAVVAASVVAKPAPVAAADAYFKLTAERNEQGWYCVHYCCRFPAGACCTFDVVYCSL
jgi:hypothetical protein